MSKGMHGGLSGKARKIHGKSRAERMYAQQLIEEFLVCDDEFDDRVIPVKPADSDSTDSRYAYEFVAEAQAEVAQSAEAERFAEAMNAVPILDTNQDVPSVTRPTVTTDDLAENAIGTMLPPDSKQVEERPAPQNVEILHAVEAKRAAEKSQVSMQWTAKVQPKLFTLRPARKSQRPQLTLSGLAAGLAIGAALGAVLLAVLSLIV